MEADHVRINGVAEKECMKWVIAEAGGEEQREGR